MKKYIALFALFYMFSAQAQTGSISGYVLSNEKPVAYVKVKIEGENAGAITDSTGYYSISLPYGTYTLSVSDFNFSFFRKTFQLQPGQSQLELKIELISNPLLVDQVVVTGTRTDKRRTESPVIVGVISSKTLENVEACNLSEGLKFQPGLRVETDCQTCNYTQLRMNGLAGGYSQILINGRPVFSPLTGLYGLEQIPTNMIERIEVVRGGGSALYGSSAIGGTVNVITKIPKNNSFSFSNNYQNVNGQASDNIFSGNATVLTQKRKAGVSFFVNNRHREYYDHNGDNFSELPELKNTSFGTTLFILPTEHQKIELSFSNLNEYRYGGEMVKQPAHLALQSEERLHNVLVGSADYQVNFNNDNSSFIIYAAGQQTDRKHYTGILPEDSIERFIHLSNPPYGTSLVRTIQGGAQINHRIDHFLKGKNVLTFGTEYVYDDVFDEIPSYQYLIDQTTTNLGVFFQSDWEIVHDLVVLLGIRADKHNLLSNFVVSPRASIMYTLRENTQFRLTWGKGFRAPQAFDTDLHIAFAGGGVSRIILSDNLHEERSNSLSASVNYDKRGRNYIAGYTLEAFYTQLNGAFYQHPLGEDAFGEVFEKRNGDGAVVQGVSLELRANFKKIIEIESGFTYQSSEYNHPVLYSDELSSTRNFLRTPNTYGFATVFITPLKNWKTSVNLVYTGPMTILHFAGAPELNQDTYFTSTDFTELGLKTGYTFTFETIGLEVFAGVKNILNAYQNDFDTGKNRDSNYIYGPAQPRTFFAGLKIKSL